MEKDLLRLNLQYFADGEGAPKPNDEGKGEPKPNGEGEGNPGDVDPNDDSGGGEEPKPKEKQTDEKTFSQSEVNEIVKERLAREKKAQEAADEQKRLEAQGEYKELLEKEREKVAELEQKEAQRERESSIVKAFKNHGIKDDDIASHFKWVDKSIQDGDDIEAVVKEYVETVNVSSAVDPSAGFGDTKRPKPKDDEEAGQEMLDRVRGLTRVKL